jgi:hypothetical protein
VTAVEHRALREACCELRRLARWLQREVTLAMPDGRWAYRVSRPREERLAMLNSQIDGLGDQCQAIALARPAHKEK